MPIGGVGVTGAAERTQRSARTLPGAVSGTTDGRVDSLVSERAIIHSAMALLPSKQKTYKQEEQTDHGALLAALEAGSTASGGTRADEDTPGLARGGRGRTVMERSARRERAPLQFACCGRPAVPAVPATASGQ
ncbi:unnamed protein product [Lampetra planeri]